MILNDGQVEIVRKHYLSDILTEVQRGKVNIKGWETGIKGTDERILHRPYPPSQAVRDRPFEKKKEKYIRAPVYMF